MEYVKPKIASSINFVYAPGSSDWSSYPTNDDLLNMPIMSDYSLTEIRYKNDGPIGDLSALQLAFANGEETQVFDARRNNQPMKSIRVNKNANLGYASVKLVAETNTRSMRILGLRIWNRAGIVLVDETWYQGNSTVGNWTDR